MADGYRNSAGVDFVSLFDPDTLGDGPTADGYKKSDGTLIKYADIKYGSKGPDVGYRDSSGVDLSNKWAAAGTANYKLSWDGSRFSGGGTAAPPNSAFGSVVLKFTSPTTYTITSSGTGLSPITHTYTVPDGCTEFYISNTPPTQFGAGGTLVNNAQSWVQLASVSTSTNYFSVSASNSSNTGTNEIDTSMTLYFGANGAAIYSGTGDMDASADISA